MDICSHLNSCPQLWSPPPTPVVEGQPKYFPKINIAMLQKLQRHLEIFKPLWGHSHELAALRHSRLRHLGFLSGEGPSASIDSSWVVDNWKDGRSKDQCTKESNMICLQSPKIYSTSIKNTSPFCCIRIGHREWNHTSILHHVLWESQPTPSCMPSASQLQSGVNVIKGFACQCKKSLQP